MELFSEINVSAPEIRAIAGGLYTIALVDGLDHREVTFITDLLRARSAGSSSDDVGATADSIPASITPLDPLALAALLPTLTHRKLFLKAANMLAWADGKVSFAERASIDAFASALGVTSDALAHLEAEVKDHLL